MVNSEEIKSNHSHKTGSAIYSLEMVKNQCSREDSLGIARKKYCSRDTHDKSWDVASNGHFSYSCYSWKDHCGLKSVLGARCTLIWFNAHNNSMSWHVIVALLSPCYWRETWGSDRLDYLPKGTVKKWWNWDWSPGLFFYYDMLYLIAAIYDAYYMGNGVAHFHMLLFTRVLARLLWKLVSPPPCHAVSDADLWGGCMLGLLESGSTVLRKVFILCSGDLCLYFPNFLFFTFTSLSST